MPRRTPGVVRALRSSSDKPIITYALIGINMLVYILQWTSGDWVFQQFAYAPVLTSIEPWRMITTTFLHSQQFIPHILLNMYSLFVIGPSLEQFLGRYRYLALYLIAGFGGSVGVLLLGQPGTAAIGASGAIFGLLGAHFIVQRRLGGSTTQLLIVIAINLVIGFIVPGVAWQAHVGGLVVGGAVAAIYVRVQRRQLLALQVALVAAIVIVLAAVSAIKVLVF